MAKERFGPDIFQGQLSPVKGPFDVAQPVPALTDVGFYPQPNNPYIRRPLPEPNNNLFQLPPAKVAGAEELLAVNRFENRGMPNSLMNFGPVLQGFAEGGEVEGMNE
ncbi:MAG: hypothetical protein VW907_08480, partial [Opitutae bacterium]